MQSRAVIGEAGGILRSQSNVSRQDAFAMLVNASQRLKIKLREVARDIIERPAGVDPDLARYWWVYLVAASGSGHWKGAGGS